MNLEFLEQKASQGDGMAGFSIEIACFTYYLLSQDAQTDTYWNQAVKEFESIVGAYSKDSVQSKWGWAILKAADDICAEMNKS